MNDHTSDITAPVAKVVTAWAFVGITSWAEAASFAAFVYTMWLIGEKAWKSIIRPYAIRRGWIKP